MSLRDLGSGITLKTEEKCAYYTLCFTCYALGILEFHMKTMDQGTFNNAYHGTNFDIFQSS